MMENILGLQIVVLFQSAQPAAENHCHCEERSDVAISSWND